MIVLKNTYIERSQYCLSPLAKALFELMEEKKTNLALSADVTSASELLKLAHLLGPEICMLKTHIDIVNDFSPELSQQLQQIAAQHHFFIFEDRKFADIGNTVKHQYQGGVYRIADWAHFVNAHSLPGPGIIEGLAEVGLPKQRGLILLAEMSSAGHLMDAEYIKKTVAMAEQFPDFVVGFITQHALSQHPRWLNITPGVKLSSTTDTLGQQYVSPQKAILDNGSDIIIVGRGIIQTQDPLLAAQEYRHCGWQSYIERCRK